MQATLQPELTMLPPTSQLLVEGGDERIALDPQSGLNRYHCPPFPDPQLLAFGSSTASVISEPAFAAAEHLRSRLVRALSRQSAETIYAHELARMRHELLGMCGIDDGAGVEPIFAGSGTDLHRIAAQLAGGDAAAPLLAVAVETCETGSTVSAALSACRQRGDAASPAAVEVAHVRIRQPDGAVRALDMVDAEVEGLVESAVAAGRRVLLILIDQSKSGLIAPSPACAMALRQRHPGTVRILVDACQFRLTPATVRAYLQQGFAVALTGSKFMTGPTFSGALLLPAPAWQPPHAPPAVNFGLLLRWEAALTEMRPFFAADPDRIAGFLGDFAQAVGEHLHRSATFIPLPQPALARRPLTEGDGWDSLPTIFPFLLQHSDLRPINRDETTRLYRWLQRDLSGLACFHSHMEKQRLAALRCQLGQPVACGERDGVPVSALRLCISSRMVVAASAQPRQSARIISQAIAALDKAELLVRHIREIASPARGLAASRR